MSIIKTKMENWQIKLIDNPMLNAKDLLIYRRHLGKIYLYKGNSEVELPVDGSYNKEDVTLHLEEGMLQDLMDALSRLNIKPKQASKTEGLYEAQSEHLKDLRKLLKL